MRIPFNLNREVYVKLTEAGMAQWYRHQAEFAEFMEQALRKPWPYATMPPPEADAQGFRKFQLHALMHVFGPMAIAGRPSCFEGANILIDSEDLK